MLISNQSDNPRTGLRNCHLEARERERRCHGEAAEWPRERKEVRRMWPREPTQRFGKARQAAVPGTPGPDHYLWSGFSRGFYEVEHSESSLGDAQGVCGQQGLRGSGFG